MSSSNTNTLSVTIPVTANTQAFTQQVQQAVSNANAQKAVVSVAGGVSATQGQQSGYAGAAGVAHGSSTVAPGVVTPGKGAPTGHTVQHPNVGGGAYQGGGSINPPTPPHSGRPPMSNPNYFQARFSTNGNMGVRSRLSGDNIMALEAGYAASRIGGEYVQLQANQARNGGNDVTGQAQLIASGISAGIGLAAGIGTRNPGIGLAAAGISGAILTPVANYLSAGADNKQNAANSVTPFMGAYSGTPNGYLNNRLFPHITPAGSFSSGALERITDIANSRNPGYDGERRGTIKDTAAAYGAIASGLFQGGFDPLSKSGQMYGRELSDPLRAYRERFNPYEGASRNPYDASPGHLKKSRFRPIDMLIDAAGNAIINSKKRITAEGEETLAETYTRRIATLFGAKEAPAMAKRMATLFGSLPDTGTNQADLLMHYGAEDTTTYNRIQNEKGETSVSPMLLSKVSAGVRTGARLLKRAASMPYASGKMAEDALSGEMAEVASLPRGRASDLYQELGAQRRQARSSKWAETDYLRYGQRLEGLQADASVHEALPYQPGYNYGNSLQKLGTRAGLLKTLRDRYTEGMKHPEDFGIDQQRATYSAFESARVQQAHDVSVLAEDGPDRLAALSAGRPSSFSRYDSVQLAQTALSNVGANHIRKYGAKDGKQLGQQQQWLAQFNTPNLDASFAASPRSRMEGLDSTLLTDIRDILRAMAGSGGRSGPSGVRSGELRSSVNSALGLSDVLGLPPEGVN